MPSTALNISKLRIYALTCSCYTLCIKKSCSEHSCQVFLLLSQNEARFCEHVCLRYSFVIKLAVENCEPSSVFLSRTRLSTGRCARVTRTISRDAVNSKTDNNTEEKNFFHTNVREKTHEWGNSKLHIYDIYKYISETARNHEEKKDSTITERQKTHCIWKEK